MTLNWKRVRLLIWLRTRQAANARKRNRTGGGFAGFALIALFAVLVFTGTLFAGYALPPESTTFSLLAWDFWAAFSCYLWLAGLAAEAQRADPVDTSRLLHLPVSLLEAFTINFLSSCVTLANIVGLAGAMGLACGQAVHRPAMLLMIPLAAVFLLTITAWVQVLRTWFLKVFRNPRRRAWLSIVAGLFLALAGQLPNLVNLVRMGMHRDAGYSSQNPKHREKYDPAWAVLPPDAKFDTNSVSLDFPEEGPPRIYAMPDHRAVYRLTYTRTRPSKPSGGAEDDPPIQYGRRVPENLLDKEGRSYWSVNYCQVRDGVWRAAKRPADEATDISVSPGFSQVSYYTRASESIDGVPADLRDLGDHLIGGMPDAWKEAPGTSSSSSFLTPVVENAHAFIPLGWPGWVASSGASDGLFFPLMISLCGLGFIGVAGLRRAWRIHGQAILMADKPGTAAKILTNLSEEDRRGLVRTSLVKAASLLRPMRPFPPATVCLVRTMTRQWRRSVEMRFLIITACALAAGAVAATVYLRYAGTDAPGAFRITCSMAAVLILAFATLFVNQFGYDRGGCRALVLAPVSARTILMAKNLAAGRLVLLTSIPFAALI